MKNKENKNLKLESNEFIDNRTPGIIYVIKMCGIKKTLNSFRNINKYLNKFNRESFFNSFLKFIKV